MIFTFSGFTLNSNKKELHYNNEKVVLTKQNYDLLLFFLSKDGALISKNEIIEHVWKGRVVADNTVDKSFTKLKKVLNGCKEQDYFESQYGQGMKFLPIVSIATEDTGPEKQSLTDLKTDQSSKTKPLNNTKSHSKWLWYVVPTFVMAFILVTVLIQSDIISIKDNQKQANQEIQPLLLILPADSSQSHTQWWSANNTKFIQQILGDSHAALIKDYKTKPKNLNTQQYLEQQWKISPQLNVLTTKIKKDNNTYTLELELKDKNQVVSHFTVSHNGLNQLYTQANNWLIKKLQNDSNEFNEISLPNNQILLENYLRGLAEVAVGEDEKAAHYFEICIIEDSTFYLARLALAEVKNRLGMQQESLAILDTLSSLVTNPYIEVHAESIRGLIYTKTGKPLLAEQTYLNVLEKHKNSGIFELNNIQLSLSYIYANITENEKAINQLNNLISRVAENQFPEFIAEVHRKKASLLQKIGQTAEAKVSINKAKILFNKLGDLIGEAKVHTLLARLAQHEADYEEATKQLNHSLAIVRAMKNKIGIGATLNELIYVQLTQGQFEKAWNLTQELESIATEIDYSAMLLAAKQFHVDIARVRQQWQKAEIYLSQHKELAINTQNKRAEINNKLLEIDLLLDIEKPESIPALLEELQSYINDKKEIRMQPRINIKRARYLSLMGDFKTSETLLISTYELALETNDTESLIQINNELAELFIKQNLADKAIEQLKQSYELNPFSYPYELLMSKSYELQGDFIKALEFANQCKNKANEFWQSKDEAYLTALVKKTKS